MFDYTKFQTETAAKKQAREDLANLFLKFLQKEFGEENVGFVDTNTVGFAFGTIKDRDGYECDLVATVKPVIKNYQDHVGEKRKLEAYDLYEEIQIFKEGAMKNVKGNSS